MGEIMFFCFFVYLSATVIKNKVTLAQSFPKVTLSIIYSSFTRKRLNIPGAQRRRFWEHMWRAPRMVIGGPRPGCSYK